MQMKDREWFFQMFAVKVFIWSHYQKISNDRWKHGRGSQRQWCDQRMNWIILTFTQGFVADLLFDPSMGQLLSLVICMHFQSSHGLQEHKVKICGKDSSHWRYLYVEWSHIAYLWLGERNSWVWKILTQDCFGYPHQDEICLSQNACFYPPDMVNSCPSIISVDVWS